jgi:hypothetical protein
LGFPDWKSYRASVADELLLLEVPNPWDKAATKISLQRLKDLGGSINVFNTGRNLTIEKHSWRAYTHVKKYLHYQGKPIRESNLRVTGEEKAMGEFDTAKQANLREHALQHGLIHVLGFEYGQRLFSSCHRPARTMNPMNGAKLKTGIVTLPCMFQNPARHDLNENIIMQ